MTMSRNWFSPSTVWVLGIRLGSKCLYPLRHLAGPGTFRDYIPCLCPHSPGLLSLSQIRQLCSHLQALRDPQAPAKALGSWVSVLLFPRRPSLVLLPLPTSGPWHLPSLHLQAPPQDCVCWQVACLCLLHASVPAASLSQLSHKAS